MITIAEAIKSINPNAEFVYTEEDINTIEWHNETTPISVSDIEEKQLELQIAYDNAEYQRNRAKEYPSMADQLDKIYHSGITEWKKVIKAVKDKYPKE